jgi:hypothetical protein
MVRRAGARRLSDPPAGQQRIDDALATHEREELGSGQGRRERGRAEPPPFDQRVEFWLLEREEALAQRGELEPRAPPRPARRTLEGTPDPAPEDVPHRT